MRRSPAALWRVLLALLLALPLSLAGVTLASALPALVTVDCVGDGTDPDDCTPVDPPPSGDPVPSDPPVEQPPAQQPPAEQAPAQQNPPASSYDDSEDDSAPAAPPAPSPTATVKPSPSPTPTPTPTLTAEPAVIHWDFPMYTGEPEHDANLTTLAVLAVSLLAAATVVIVILVRRLVFLWLRRAKPTPPAPEGLAGWSAPENSDFAVAVVTDRSRVTPR